jgi:two-component system CAI-1 autoinducer sensor kinase/phosphatase CqsS
LKTTINKLLNSSEFSILSLGLIGFIGHPLFWLIWTYVFPQKYDNFTLRAIGSIICLGFLLKKKWPKILKHHFSIFWFFGSSFVLPFIFTIHLIANDYSIVWLMCQVGMFFMITVFFHNFFTVLLNLFMGILAAILYSIILLPGKEIFINLEYLPIFCFALAGGFVFSYSALIGAKNEEKSQLLESLSASIAHELKNPLAAIKMKIIATHNSMQQFKISDEEDAIFRECFMFVQNSIKRANDIIAITLSELRGEKFIPDELIYMEINHILEEAVGEYGYENNSDKEKIKFNFEDDFIFRGDKAAFIYVIFNLVKNSLYYSTRNSNFQITISAKKSEKQNIIIVEDNGPGIKKEFLNKIFESFYTLGKRDGTGLGLPFCKRAIESFGGTIKCKSEFGKWTKFIILLPIVDHSTSARAKKEIDLRHKSLHSSIFLKTTRAKILLVDDYKVNVVPLKAKIEAHLPNFLCDIEIDSTKVPALIAKEKYNLILMDLNMPEMDGFECAKAIRKIDKKIPILAHTSHKTTEVAQKAIKAGMNGFMTKPCDNMVMLRNVSKWCFNEFSSIGIINKKDTKKLLGDKVIVLIDDQQINLTMMTAFIKQYAKEVISFYNPQEALIEIKKHYKKIDIVVTDINMPGLSGDELAVEIRKLESKYSKLYLPIIALTGEVEDEAIHEFLQKGMTDFVVKGSDLDYMTQIIALWSNTLTHGTKYDIRSNKEILSIFNINEENRQKIGKLKQQNISDNNDGAVSNHTIIQHKIFNKNKLEFLDKEELCDVLNTFKKDSAKILQSIKDSIEKKDIEQIFQDTHALKGIAGSAGMELLNHYLMKMNNIFRNKKMPEDPKWIIKLEELLKQVINEIS